MKVALDYKLYDESAWRTAVMTPALYFDASALDGFPTVDDLPRFDHAVDYLTVDRRKLETTVITIADGVGSERVIAETFWNEGENRIIERTDRINGVVSFWEVIIDSAIKSPERMTEILRIGRVDGLLTLRSHVFVVENKDGSETELCVFPG